MSFIEIGVAGETTVALVAALAIGIWLGVKLVEWFDNRYKTRK